MSDINIRSLAADIVSDVLEKKIFLHVEMRHALDKYGYLPKEDKAFLVRLSSGTVERAVTVDAVIDHFSKTPVRKMKPFIRSLMRISAYQIMYMDSVPDSAACNEAVKLVRKRHFDNLAGFVNGVLRSISRDWRDVSLSENEELSISQELLGLFKSQYPEDYRYILEAFLNDSHETVIRFNLSKVTTQRMEQIVKKYSMKVISEDMGLCSVSGTSIEDIDGYSEGLFTVQDTAAALPVWLADVQEDMNVLDLCAAPGGKSVQALDMMADTGRVVSRDISEAKLPMIEETADRCGFRNIWIEVGDASEFIPEDSGKYDIVLADVPCSGLGIIGNKPDIKYNYTEEATEELIALSKKIIMNAGRYVKPDGLLVFSTCTLNKHENEDVCDYIRNHFDCETVDVKKRIPDCISKYNYTDGCLTVLPEKGVCSGFFTAIFKIRGVKVD